jgi:hypothetical protein
MNGKQPLESESAVSPTKPRGRASRDKVSCLTAAGMPGNVRALLHCPRRCENERTQRAESTTLSPCSTSSRRLNSARPFWERLCQLANRRRLHTSWRDGLASHLFAFEIELPLLFVLTVGRHESSGFSVPWTARLVSATSPLPIGPGQLLEIFGSLVSVVVHEDLPTESGGVPGVA